MRGKSIFGMFLLIGLMFAGNAWAEVKPDQVRGNPYPGQVDSWHETDVPSAASNNDSVDVAAYEKVAAAGAEAVPGGSAPDKLESGTAKTADVKPDDAKSQDLKSGDAKSEDIKQGEIEAEEGSEPGAIADPIEPINRAMFVFNDKLYFWFFKPVAQAYNVVFPEVVRVSVRNFFRNATMPIRFVNCILQGKFESAGIELVRFGVNTTVGLAGFMDIAKDHFELTARNEDMGQTFGLWGMGGWMYIVWPFIGPSTVRDTIGMVGDTFLDPISYINPLEIPLGVHAFERLNKTSLELGSYEDIVNSALDPYIAVRDAFIQHRNVQIKQ